MVVYLHRDSSLDKININIIIIEQYSSLNMHCTYSVTIIIINDSVNMNNINMGSMDKNI